MTLPNELFANFCDYLRSCTRRYQRIFFGELTRKIIIKNKFSYQTDVP